MTNIYYIPELRSNILSLGQATEQGYDIRMKENYLTLKDPNGRLLVKALRLPNRLYKLRLEVGRLACLHTRLEDEPCRWGEVIDEGERLMVVNNNHYNDHNHIETGGNIEGHFEMIMIMITPRMNM